MRKFPMCFNAAMMQPPEVIEELFGTAFPADRFDTPTRFLSAFEHPVWPILKQGAPEAFQPAVWGLVPAWTRSADDAASIRDKTLNARFETIAMKPSFRSCVDRRRCGVLVDGFVEWRSFDGKKYPYHIALPDKRPFLLAGLWDRWADPGSDSVLESFAVVTTAAAGLPAQIHNTKLRMPFILGKAAGKAWLDAEASFRTISAVLQPFYKALTAWPVSKDVSKPGMPKDIPGIQDPVVYPELPDLEPI